MKTRKNEAAHRGNGGRRGNGNDGGSNSYTHNTPLLPPTQAPILTRLRIALVKRAVTGGLTLAEHLAVGCDALARGCDALAAVVLGWECEVC